MILVSGMLIGLFGSLHCVGMCGPIAMTVHTHGTGLRPLLYNVGRLIAYLSLGLVFGILGEGLSLFGWQQSLSILMGVSVILFALYPKFQSRLINTPWHRYIVAPLKKQLVGLLKSKNAASYVIVGVLNGLLPCGLVYLALASGLALMDLAQATLLMAGFALGTFPFMLGIGWGSSLLKKRLQGSLRFVVPAFAIVVGLMLVVRGLALDIPYLSPVVSFVGLGKGVVTCQ